MIKIATFTFIVITSMVGGFVTFIKCRSEDLDCSLLWAATTAIGIMLGMVFFAGVLVVMWVLLGLILGL